MTSKTCVMIAQYFGHGSQICSDRHAVKIRIKVKDIEFRDLARKLRCISVIADLHHMSRDISLVFVHERSDIEATDVLASINGEIGTDWAGLAKDAPAGWS